MAKNQDVADLEDQIQFLQQQLLKQTELIKNMDKTLLEVSLNEQGWHHRAVIAECRISAMEMALVHMSDFARELQTKYEYAPRNSNRFQFNEKTKSWEIKPIVEDSLNLAG